MQTYSEDLKAFGRANPKFVMLVEKTFAEFIGGSLEKKVLPSMGAQGNGMGKRGFVTEVRY